MYKDESVSDAWNNGFEAGISFAKAKLEAERNNPQPTTITPEPTTHDFGCLIYLCTCGGKKE